MNRLSTGIDLAQNRRNTLPMHSYSCNQRAGCLYIHSLPYLYQTSLANLILYQGEDGFPGFKGMPGLKGCDGIPGCDGENGKTGKKEILIMDSNQRCFFL